MNYEIRTTCPECRGTGRNLDNANCGRCWGSGEATTTKKGTTVNNRHQITKTSTQRIVKSVLATVCRKGQPASYQDLLDAMHEENIFMPARLVDDFIRFAQDEGHQGISVCLMVSQSMARELDRANNRLRNIADAVAGYVQAE